jgi:hypothetical protein
MAKKSDTREKSKMVAGASNHEQADKLEKLRTVLEQRHRGKQQAQAEADHAPAPPQVSLGPAGAIVDALLNTAPGHMLELTDFDRNQVTLVPQVVVTDDMWDFVEHTLMYRMDKGYYFSTYKRRFPEIPDTSRKFVFTLAQTRRSLGGKMKKALEDMALAELETKSMDDGAGFGGHDFED